jgi:hypothetical protein
VRWAGLIRRKAQANKHANFWSQLKTKLKQTGTRGRVIRIKIIFK